MKALVYHGPGQRAWEDVPDPTIQEPTDAIVRIDSSTICGTDLHLLLAELIGEAQFRLAPLTDLDAVELLRTGKAGRLVAGFRGAPPADESALVDLLLRLSLLAEELPEVVELDLNPVLALPDRCFAVDARVRVAEHDHARRTKSW